MRYTVWLRKKDGTPDMTNTLNHNTMELEEALRFAYVMSAFIRWGETVVIYDRCKSVVLHNITEYRRLA